MTGEDVLGPGGSRSVAPAYAEAILQELGLASTEMRSYRYLLSTGGATPTMVARETGQSRGRIYETLENLVKRGMARVEPTRPLRYIPVPLAEVVSITLADAFSRAQRLRAAYDSLLQTSNLVSPPNPPKLEPLTPESLTALPALGPPPADIDPVKVELQYYETIAEAQRRVCCMGPEGWSRHLTQGWQATIGLYAHAKRRGVRFQGLTPSTPREREALNPFRAIWEFRTSEWLPAWVVLVDDSHLFQAVPAASPGGEAVLRHSRESQEIRFYRELFERLWDRAEPWAAQAVPTA